MTVNLSVYFFALLSVLAVASALVTILSKNPITSAISLVFHFFMLAGLYLTLNAQFLAVVQILVYAGAIMVLVVFVIMLLNLGSEQQLPFRFNIRGIIALLLAASFVLLVSVFYFINPFGLKFLPETSLIIGSAGAIGLELFRNYLFPFEAVSLLLLVAMIGAIILAKRNVE